MSTSETREDAFLENVLPRYIAEGFTVVRHPSPTLLPSFMGKYRPDAIALKAQKKIAIEVKHDVPSTQANVSKISRLFDEHPDWELKVYYLPKFVQERNLEPPTQQTVEDTIAEIENLKADGHIAAALMMAWAALEATSRALLPQRLARAQPAGRLVEVLASEGLLTPIEADPLHRAVVLRNAVVHGDFGVEITAERIDELVTSLRVLAGILSQTGCAHIE
jgi:uncharacterized protein YutE (UPF0331/DUF86 family)